MFGALNRFIGRLDGEPQAQTAPHGAAGFQILRSTNKELALEPWFDFIIGINGRTLDNSDPNLFAAEVRNCGGSTISLGIWSAKGQKIKEIYAPIPVESPSLGLSLQWAPLSSTEDVWHVLEVAPNSPADKAGLLPYGDYIIGSPEGIVRGESGLPELIEDFLDQPLKLFVYNHEYNVTRPVELSPSRHWGGQGALGCTLGFGALHRIPAPLEEPPHGPGETMFDTSLDEKQALAAAPANTDFLVPANMQFDAPKAPAGPPVAKRERKVRHHASPNAEIDEYFREGEQKSREEDHAPSPKPGGPGVRPPPPKVGPPPKAASPAAKESE
ncbi:hypothetical protein BT63DRAFT_434568 [Microthyrium microscopicum]|uniref:PDZ GRASP-type domain-containing protein n=1 Tax=Microthyrium microscopicum TaxID=703497 RepID=A0A6A6U0D8_9PEZI|nr:hypothetical protein BT63DRAFT_434568 [Microthyrium microscopicum]